MARRTAWGFYAQITTELRRRITDGTYRPGSRLPGEIVLCVEFGVTRNTVRRALSALQDEGLITARMGLGHFVHDASDPPCTRSEQITAQLRRQIESGHFQPGEALPGEIQLAKRYGVSRFTARKALRALESAGLVTCIRGKGRYVRQDVPR